MSGNDAPFETKRVGRAATLVISAQITCVLLFVAGGAMSIATAARNGQSSVNCFGAIAGACAHHHSYTLGITLLVVGFVGLLVTIAVAARMTIGLGLGALSYVQRRRSLMESAPPAPPS